MNIQTLEKSVTKSRWFVAGIFGLTIGAYAVWFYLVQQQVISTNSNDWGTFGDFVGGLLNPLVAFSAFYWLTVSVLIQKQELGDTKKALIESSKAQKEQAQYVHLQSRIEAINMLYQKVNIALEAELAYRNTIIGKSDHMTSHVMNKYGGLSIPKEEIKSSNIFIEKLEKQQHDLILKVEGLLK